MCFGVNVGLCVHCKLQVCRLSTKKIIEEKFVRKEKSLKQGNVCAQIMLFAQHRKIVWLRYLCGIGLLMKKIDYYFQLTVSYDSYVILRKIICSFH